MKHLFLKLSVLFLLLIVLIHQSFSQTINDTCFAVKRGTENGFDAYLASYSSNVNYFGHTDFGSVGWTCNGSPCFGRCVIQFGLPILSGNYQFVSASLNLYANPTPSSNGGQVPMQGTNESLLERIISPWNDNSVTWANQPLTTPINQVVLQQSSQPNQDYTNIDVTGIVGDIYNDLQHNYGMMIRLSNESYYNTMIFASSEHSDTTRRPVLHICFTNTTGILENKTIKTLNIFPNPVKDYLSIKVTSPNVKNLFLYNSLGEQLSLSQMRTEIYSGVIKLNVQDLSAGIYFVKVDNGFNHFVKE